VPAASARLLWNALDHLAAENGLSPSGLARQAGLDPTALNPSRRQTPDGHFRLPRLETLLALLAATDTSLSAFARMTESQVITHDQDMEPPERGSSRLPVVPFSGLDATGLFDHAHIPVVRFWSRVASPFADAGPYDYAIRLDVAAYEPVYRKGALLLASVDSGIRQGDRVVMCGAHVSGMARGLALVKSCRENAVTVRRLDNGEELDVPRDAATVLHRITAATF
jgi:phage repressor protein C with HTH and peptisase S24 domain